MRKALSGAKGKGGATAEVGKVVCISLEFQEGHFTLRWRKGGGRRTTSLPSKKKSAHSALILGAGERRLRKVCADGGGKIAVVAFKEKVTGSVRRMMPRSCRSLGKRESSMHISQKKKKERREDDPSDLCRRFRQ